jgi:putative ABC transport system substrate-binding protein
MPVNIGRRELIATFGGVAAWPLTAPAQGSERVRRIGILHAGNEGDPDWQDVEAAFVQGLAKLGWTEGANVVLDHRWGGSDRERIRGYAAELISLHPDAIWVAGGFALLLLKRQTRTIPIVFTQAYDPVGSGYVASLARPEANITGFTLGEFSMGGKMLEALREVAPQVSRAAVILNLDQPPQVAIWHTLEAALEVSAAPSFGVRVTALDVQGAAEIENAIGEFAHEPKGGLIVLPGVIATAHRELIIALAVRHHLPAIYAFRFFVADGGLMSYGADRVDEARQAAGYVDRILKGAKPSDLPVQQPTKFELVINLKTAKALGLEVSPTLLNRADEVIE